MLIELILFAGFSGITVFLGGLLSNYFEHHIPETPVKPIISHTIMAFGGGIILSAVALVLVPEGMKELTLLPLCLSFIGGSIAFSFLDRFLAKKGGQVGTLLAMMMDFIPESIALGAIFGANTSTATLLAIFIGLQNLPEAFNSFRDMVISGFSVKSTLVIFFFISFFGIAAALLGKFFLSDSPLITAHLMIFASGGILYLIFQDVVPEVKMKNSYFISLGGTAGFLVGIIGQMVLG
ncbi:MAG: divalent cation transporter [Fulvivirga sp.]